MRRLAIILAAAAFAVPLAAGSAQAWIVAPARPAIAARTTNSPIDQVRWHRHYHHHWRHHWVRYHHHRYWRRY